MNVIRYLYYGVIAVRSTCINNFIQLIKFMIHVQMNVTQCYYGVI